MILEDDQTRLELIDQYKLNNLKKFSFNDGIKNLNISQEIHEIYISVSSSPFKRYKTRNLFKNDNFIFPRLFQKSSKISKFSEISCGTYLGDYVTVEANSCLGDFTFINSHSHIGHDSKVGNYCTFGGSVTLNGRCIIEDYCLIGSSVTVINNKRIGRGSVIQAGTCIIQDIPEFSFVSGNPVKILPVEILGKNFSESRNIK